MTETGKPADQASPKPSSRRSRFGFTKGFSVQDDLATVLQDEIVATRDEDAGPAADASPRKP